MDIEASQFGGTGQDGGVVQARRAKRNELCGLGLARRAVATLPRLANLISCQSEHVPFIKLYL